MASRVSIGKGRMIINGYTIDPSMIPAGSSISIFGDRVVVDGVSRTFAELTGGKMEESKEINIQLVECKIQKLEVNRCNIITADTSEIDEINLTSGSITAKDVGDIEMASGSIECHEVKGNVNSQAGNITAWSIGGRVRTMTGNIHKDFKK
jgi:hypothetical protein